MTYIPEEEKKKEKATKRRKHVGKEPKGAYGLDKEGEDVEDMDPEHTDAYDGSGGSDGGSMGESFAQTQVRKAAATTKSLAKFKERAEAAKKRQSDKDALHKKMRAERKTKGIRFSDASGKGYIKDGKKTYDAK